MVCAAGSPSLLSTQLSKARATKPFRPRPGRLREACLHQPAAQAPARSITGQICAFECHGGARFWAPPPGLSLGRCSWRPSHGRGRGDTPDSLQHSNWPEATERRQPVMKEGQAIYTRGAEGSPLTMGTWTKGAASPPERGQLGGGQAGEAPRPALPLSSWGSWWKTYPPQVVISCLELTVTPSTP